MSDVTRILNAIEGGDTKATDELLPLVYDELRLLAAQKLSHEKLIRHSRYVMFQMAEVAVPRNLFGEILARIRQLRLRPG